VPEGRNHCVGRKTSEEYHRQTTQIHQKCTLISENDLGDAQGSQRLAIETALGRYS